MFKHYLKCFVNEKQINWANLLSLTKFVNNSNLHKSADFTSFHLIYEYHSKICYEVENNFSKKNIVSKQLCRAITKSLKKVSKNDYRKPQNIKQSITIKIKNQKNSLLTSWFYCSLKISIKSVQVKKYSFCEFVLNRR